ncbi:ACT domain-containing protein [Lentibacillus cibarius]|uniref:ACT domain-containing protein n=1 Tax=Lentibacillus cibarius TaxID=2583219 RepID=A0A5S3QFZ1_9BACI|nr:ACT domain-containing protein [Lentibacillus cibarius]TMN20815.1 ACT domain-containing protein [Lentibacillus cibarius]
MNLSVLHEKIAILKGSPDKNIPSWIFDNKKFISVTYTEEELSVVCLENVIPDNHEMVVEKGWRCIKVDGPLDFSLTGVLTSLASPLAEASISIFAVSTYNTDYLLIKEHSLEKALEVLTKDGHNIRGE